MRGTQTAEADRGSIQVIARAAAILRALEAEPDGLSLGELAGRTGLARSTVQRIVAALGEQQLLMSAGPRAGVTLGPALIRLAAAANIKTDQIVRPILQDLSRTMAETVDLSALQGRSAVFVDQIVGKSRLVAISAVGEAFPLHCTANGKALLTCFLPDRIASLVNNRMTAHTPNTITSLPSLIESIGEARRTGLASDVEEHSEGICALGTAFIDPLGRDFALSVPVPTSRFTDKRDDIARHLLAARAAVMKAVPGSRLPEG